jgi:beta-galactosidase
VLMTFKSGFTNENNAVRWVRAPGPLREAAGFSYQEFSNLETPLALKDDPFHAGTGNQVSYWAEFLMPEHAKALAYYDHPFFGRWPAITENQFGSGSLTYEGTYLTEALQRAVLLGVLKEAGVVGPDQSLPAPVRVKHGVNGMGNKIHYYLNYSGQPQSVPYAYAAGVELTTGAAVHRSSTLQIKEWDVAIVEENQGHQGIDMDAAAR